MDHWNVYSVTAPALLLEFLLDRADHLSRNSVKHLLSRGQVLVDGVVQKQFDLPLSPGQQVTLLPQAKGPALPFPILYEDEALIAISKPAGLLSVSTQSESQRTAFQLLTRHLRDREAKARLWVVHRLDRDTSGVLLFAKEEALKRALQSDWNQRVRRRGYWAVVEGEGLPSEGVCRSALTENRVHRVYSSPAGRGKPAVTRYRTLSQKPGYTLLDVELDTGRKNQIRVHLSELGHPVAGDKKYGSVQNPMGRLALHAYQLSLMDPRDSRLRTFYAPAPPPFSQMFPAFFRNQAVPPSDSL